MPTSDQDARAKKNPGESSQKESEGRQQELNSTLDTIAAQLLDADRRHTTTLNEIQNRVAEMGREAEMMRHRVPDQFASAFARVEAGVAELGQRLSHDEAGKSDRGAQATSKPAPTASREVGASELRPQSGKAEAPMALKSANAPYGIERRQTETVDRRKLPLDNFDIIESSLSDDDADPWDRQSAEALASIYDVKGGARAPSRSVVNASDAGGVGEKSHMSAAWLENRFAEIGKSIEQSLAKRSKTDDDNFGRKLDNFEQRLAKKFEGVATQADIGVVRMIESHVGEVVNHLVQTHDQMARLNTIEEQLGHISQAVDGQGGAKAQGAAKGASTPAIDVDAIVRNAAEQTAQRFAETRTTDRNAAADELRPLIERLMADSKKGSERTAKLLDTIQQAIVRILHRVESLEKAQNGRSEMPASSGKGTARGQERSPSIAELAAKRADQGAAHSALAASASTSATNTPSSNPTDRATSAAAAEGQQPSASGSSDQKRHDFIADARRAKNRLTVADEPTEVVIANAPTPIATPAVDVADDAAQSGSRPIKPTPKVATEATSPSGPSRWLVAVALVAILVLTGLWYTFGIGDAVLNSHPAVVSSNAASDGNAEKANPANLDKRLGSETPATPVLDSNGKRGEAAQQANISPASADAPAPRTTLPLIGIAVDVDTPITATGMQQAIRHQSMATMSGEIGAEAAKSPTATAIPASIVPSENETAGLPDSAVPPKGLARARNMTDMDMPPASLGPLSLRLAAANGDPSAQFEIGSRFADGKGKTANFNDAAKWYQRSADKGFAQAEYRLGTLYERGLGLKPDRALAIKWYQLAAAQGNIKAMHNLAVLNSNQNDKSPDYAAAAYWFEEAARRDLSDSQFNLAILYENGLGVPRDMKTAYKWLSLAAREGDAEAVRRRDILRGKLTAEEMAAAQQLVSSWKPLPYDRMVNDARAAGEAWKKNPNNGVSG